MLRHPRLACIAFALSLLTSGAPVSAQDAPPANDIRMPSYPRLRESLAASAGSLTTSAAYDTIYVGHSHTNYTAGGANPWNVYVGTSRPGTGNAYNALWDFDDQTGLGAGDSLQGWWPVILPYRYASAAGSTNDVQRPWASLDQGNQLNFRPVNAAHPRTYGVISAWHADPGNAVGHVMWAPISGGRSMWCGLREQNDDVVLDPVTHQPYTEQAEQYSNFGTTTSRCFPGYGNQWDQMLYRDFTATSGTPMNIHFLYRTRMSTGFSTSSASRAGWYHGDPLSMSAGNFFSSTAAGANAPRDSFSVYVGVPVDDASCALSDPASSPAPVWDKQRRWFNEVLRLDAPRFEILGVAGANPADTAAAAIAVNQTIPWANPGNGNAYVQALYDDAHNPQHRVRLVFRVKTNRTHSDDDYMSYSGLVNAGFTSNGRGAVLLDDVVVDGTTFDFEATDGGVDNALDGSGNWVTPTTASWKSTGKPLPTWMHPVDVLSTTHWSDLCGPPHSGSSLCNLDGIVASVGNADRDESIADSRWPAFTEGVYGMISPTINLVTPASGANAMGITADMLSGGAGSLYVAYEVNTAAFVLANTGTLWNFSVQSYPHLAANGHKVWGSIAGSLRFYNSYPGCLMDMEGLNYGGAIVTSNPNGMPDSLRIYLGVVTECFYLGGTCNSNPGGYFDNISLVLMKPSASDPVSSITSDTYQFFNDAFPVNGLLTDNAAAGTAAFDTTTALVKGSGDHVSNGATDYVTVNAPDGSALGATVRVDLVFRILPGPGNYKPDPGRVSPPTSSMPLLRVPTNPSAVVTPGDASFWGQFIANPGEFASPGAHHGGTWWDPLSWNSVRCDTLESAGYPGTPTAGVYRSTYHESDPHFAGTAPGKGGQLDAGWVTVEGTKIIPDGLLTPGSHVQYFFRKQRVDGVGGFSMSPDTTNIAPQLGNYDFDGGRWLAFSVLPDRWKGSEFGGPGMACVLVIDNDDARGSGRVWASIADSLGLTAPAQWGGHDGWHAAGAGFGLYAPNNPAIAQAYVHGRNQQPGTSWDLYNVRVTGFNGYGASNIANRYDPSAVGLVRTAAPALGPRTEWLRAYYRGIIWLAGADSGAVAAGYALGELDRATEMMADFLANPVGTAQPRSLLVQGDGFAVMSAATGGAATTFLANDLFASSRRASYTNLVPDQMLMPDLVCATSLVPDGTIFGIGNTCHTNNAVLDIASPEGTAVAWYQPVGPAAPYVAAVEHVPTVAHNWHTLLLGWDIDRTFSRHGATSNGRLAFYQNALTRVFGDLGCTWSPATGVDPGEHAPQALNSFRIANSAGAATAATFLCSAAKAGVVRVALYDVAGRRVRLLADRAVAAGRFDVAWDGRDDAGNAVRRGIYFARVAYADGEKLGGRVIVLR